MCDLKAGIVLRNEGVKGGFTLLMSPWTESHSELERIFSLLPDLRDNRAKVEFSPKDMAEAYKLDSYTLSIDESRTPEWFDAEMQVMVANKMREYIRSIIISGDVDLLIGGQFIVAPGAKVREAKAMVINALCGGTITEVSGGTITEVWGGTITEVSGGTITEVRGGTITAVSGGTITEVSGGTIMAVWGGFDGYLGKITKPGKVVDDQRKRARSERL